MLFNRQIEQLNKFCGITSFSFSHQHHHRHCRSLLLYQLKVKEESISSAVLILKQFIENLQSVFSLNYYNTNPAPLSSSHPECFIMLHGMEEEACIRQLIINFTTF